MAKQKRRQGKGRNKRGNTIKLVVKSNELVEARYMFDVWETRFFLTLIASITKDDEDDKVYRIWFRDIKNNFQLKSHQSYHYLREAAISMAGKSVYIGWMNDEFRRGRMHRIIRFVDFLEDGQSGSRISQQEYVDVSIDKDIKPYLLDIKKKFDPSTTRYTSYELRNVIKLKPYAVRIYELLKQFEFKGFRTIKIEDLKDMFEITNEYPRFSNFYQKVIKESINAINKHTDLFIPFGHIEKIKKGRRVDALRFKIDSKTKDEVALLREENISPKVIENKRLDTFEQEPKLEEADLLFSSYENIVIKNFGVTPSVFIKMLTSKKYTKENIEQAIAVTRRAKYNQEIKKSVAGFFIKALQQGFTDEKIEHRKKVQQKKEQTDKLEQEYRDRRASKIKWILENVEGVRETTLAYIKEKPNLGVKKRLDQLGLDFETITVEDFRQDKILRGFFIQGIAHEFSEYLADIDAEFHRRMSSFDI